MEFRNSNQQLKYLVAVQKTGSSITFKEFKLLLNCKLDCKSSNSQLRRKVLAFLKAKEWLRKSQKILLLGW